MAKLKGKKPLILLIILTLSCVSLLPIGFCDDVVLDSFDNTLAYSFILTDVHPSDSSDDSAHGQSFKFTVGAEKYYLKSCKFLVEKWGNPTGHLKANLYEHTGVFGSGGKATGSPLASSGLIGFPKFKMWVTFTFQEPYYELEKNTPYVIACVLNDGVVDGSNYVKVWGYLGHQGNRCSFHNGFWIGSATDVGFYVFGQEVEVNKLPFLFIGLVFFGCLVTLVVYEGLKRK